MPSSSTRLPPPNTETEKVNSSTSQRSRSRRNAIILAFLALTLVFLYLTPSTTGATTASIWNKITSLAGCGSKPMSSSHQTAPATAGAEGWHARATRASSATFAPKKADLVFTALINSQVEPDGFTLALLRPNHAVDASGHVLTLEAHDFAAFEAQVRAVSENVPHTGEFMGQWRVKQARTSFPIDRVLIPGEEERAVYGWAKSDHELELEAETKGRTTLPKELQVLVGWAKEARQGYVRGQFDEGVISKVRALAE